MNLTFVTGIAKGWQRVRVWPALVLLRDVPGSDERRWIEHLYAQRGDQRGDADPNLPYHEKLNAPGMKATIAAAFADRASIPQPYKITLPLFGGNHTTMAQQMRLAQLEADKAAITDQDRLRWVTFSSTFVFCISMVDLALYTTLHVIIRAMPELSHS